MRGDADIQFAPLPQPEQKPAEPPPDWLTDFLESLEKFFAPLGRGIAENWPVLRWVLLALAVVLILWLLWRTFGPDLVNARSAPPEPEDWVPESSVAIALLEEADRLAAEGRFDEATHLLLQRSVRQIADARPELIEPSSTAREIAANSALPGDARSAFAIIAERVERSLFALRTLSAEDWQAARAAYADFALAHRSLAA